MKLILSCVLAGTLLFACTKEDAESRTPPPPAAPATPKAEVHEFNPEYTLEIKTSDTDPKKYTVHWTAKVNTGGWKLTTDQANVEESMTFFWARIYVTLEQPGPDDMVTQAFETLSGQYDAGTQKVDKAEFHVRRKVRDDKSPYAPLYGIVKQIGSR